MSNSKSRREHRPLLAAFDGTLPPNVTWDQIMKSWFALEPHFSKKEQTRNEILRISLIGDKFVDGSSLMNRYILQRIPCKDEGFGRHMERRICDSRLCGHFDLKMQISDHTLPRFGKRRPSGKKLQTLTPRMVKANVIMFCFNITDINTLLWIKKIYKASKERFVQKKLKCILVGLQCHQLSNIVADDYDFIVNQAHEIAIMMNNAPLVFCSTKTGFAVNELFDLAIAMTYEIRTFKLMTPHKILNKNYGIKSLFEFDERITNQIWTMDKDIKMLVSGFIREFYKIDGNVCPEYLHVFCENYLFDPWY